ncbi:MAG: response regulator, partial [Planctomycetota bacterium]
DPQGAIVGIKVLFWDVSQRRVAELALEHEQFLLQTLMDNLPDSIYFKDQDSRFVRVSRGLAVKFGMRDPAEVIGKTDADIFAAEHARAAREDEQRIMETGEPVLEQIEHEIWESRDDTWCSSTKLPLYDQYGEIVGTFGMSRDVTELVHAQDALHQAKEEAEEANRAKSDFLANMSHEIRTPMNAIIGITELLLADQPTPHQREYLSMVLASSESLLSIINDVLDFSKIEAGKFELLPGPCNLRNALGDTIKALGVWAHEKELELVCAFDPSVPEMVSVDIGRLRQAVINLVGNAIKFTDRGEVVVQVTAEPVRDEQTQLTIEVRDTGIGIPTEKQQRIFHEFEQADGSTTKSYGGTGLGLAISARLARLMGGDITVTSASGEGSTFELSVLCERLPSGAGAAPQRCEALAGKSVLIVDDNATNRRILCDILTNWEMLPLSAGSGEEALQLLHETVSAGTEVALVITDVNMPHMDGFSLAERIRADARLEPMPIVTLSSASRHGDRQRGERLGIHRQLSKPVKQSELLAVIADVLDCELEAAAPAAPQQAWVGLEAKSNQALRVLLAEDNVVNQRLAVGVLEKLGHDVVIASTGEEALQQHRHQHFDLILMDVQMPKMDGFEATRQIRRDEDATGKRIPIIAMTARAMQGDREACLAAGMDDYLPKPVRSSELTAVLASLQRGESMQLKVSRDESLADQVRWQEAMDYVNGNEQLLDVVLSAL